MTTSWGRRTLSISSSARRTGRRRMRGYFQLSPGAKVRLFQSSVVFIREVDVPASLRLSRTSRAIWPASFLSGAAEFLTLFRLIIPAWKMYFRFPRKMIVKLMPVLIIPLLRQAGLLQTFDLYLWITFLFLSPLFLALFPINAVTLTFSTSSCLSALLVFLIRNRSPALINMSNFLFFFPICTPLFIYFFRGRL